MIQYTDAPFTITVDDADFTAAQEIHVTVAQGEDVYFDLSESNTVQVIGRSELLVELTQAQTGAFKDNEVAKMQVNWIDANGKRKATVVSSIKIKRNLLKGVIDVEQYQTEG